MIWRTIVLILWLQLCVGSYLVTFSLRWDLERNPRRRLLGLLFSPYAIWFHRNGPHGYKDANGIWYIQLSNRGRFFAKYSSHGVFWFRICGYGMHFTDHRINPMMFSERNKLGRRRWHVGPYCISFLGKS